MTFSLINLPTCEHNPFLTSLYTPSIALWVGSALLLSGFYVLLTQKTTTHWWGLELVFLGVLLGIVPAYSNLLAFMVDCNRPEQLYRLVYSKDLLNVTVMVAMGFCIVGMLYGLMYRRRLNRVSSQ